jgi:hypothetical protein
MELCLRLRGIAAGILCFVALGKDATGRLKQKTRRFRSLSKAFDKERYAKVEVMSSSPLSGTR